ncbi:MAG: MraY family glycosyltransferase [Planctomycetota bacterium]
MTSLVLMLLAIAFGVSFVLTWGVRALARRRNLFDGAGTAGHEKPEVRTVPNVGGVAIFVTIAGGLLTGISAPAVATLPGSMIEHADGLRERTPMALALIGCLLALHVMGLIDDRRPLPAWPKLLVILVAACVPVVFFDVRLLTLLDGALGTPLPSIALTVLWFVVITNAMNFMDNMDGLAGTCAVVASACFLGAALLSGQWFVAFTLALLLGSALGFLVFNFPRRGGATIFMGDGGSLVIGYLLAFLTVRTTYHEDAGTPGYAVLMPLCVLAVPLYDFVSVVIVRLLQGKNPMVGDQQHFSHRLRERGLSGLRVVIVVGSCTAITGLAGLMLTRLDGWFGILAGAQVLLVIGVLAMLEFGEKRRER